MTDDLARWQQFVGRLDELGAAITRPPFPTTDADHTEGLRHLALQTACWLAWSIGHQDPRAPAFQRQNDLVLQWGGPNADNVYRHARVDPSLRYRIVGRMHSCNDFILAIRRNFMHMEGSGTIAELSAHDLGLGPGDDFEILLGGEGDEPNRVPLPDGALSVSIREYYFDWQPREPAIFTIECLDADGPSDRFAAADLAFGLDEAATHLHRSLTYWNQYMLDALRRPAGQRVRRRLRRPARAQGSEVCVLLLRPRARRGARRRVRHPAEPLLELPPLQPRVVGGVGVRDARHQSQSHADPHLRRRPHPRRGRARRPGGTELARHRGPPGGAPHAPVVLADG